MSSLEPYQSKLFNFFNRQSIKWRERLEISARKLKTVATWSLQLLLYPIYFLVQTGRLVQRQLTSSHVSNFQLPSSSLLDNVLESLDTPALLACDLENRQLVFTKEQEIIPLAGPEKQRIKQRIYQELVEYHRKLRLQKRRKKLLPGFLGQTFAWMEKGELATSLNLFKENQLNRKDNLELLLYSHQFARNILELIQFALDYYKKKSILPHNKVYLESKNHLITLNNSLNANSNPFQIKYIIFAALEYFFSEKKQVKPPRSSAEEEPWLTWEDFFDGQVTLLPSLGETGSPQKNNQEKKGDFIETEVIDLGYVEHSLGKTLKWLDRIILKIEKFLLKFWKWLLSKLKGKGKKHSSKR